MCEKGFSLKHEIKQGCRIAKDLGYGDEIMRRIKKAKSIGDIQQALITGRKAMKDL